MRSQRFHASFAGSDTHGVFNLGHKNFAVTDFSGFGFFQYCFHRALGAIVRDHNFEFNLRKKIYRIFRAAINFAVPLLPAKSFYLAQSHSFNACGDQGFSDWLGFEWFNYGLDFLHRGKLNLPAFEMASTRDCITKQSRERHHQTFRPNFFSSSDSEIWIIVGRPCGQQ